MRNGIFLAVSGNKDVMVISDCSPEGTAETEENLPSRLQPLPTVSWEERKLRK